MDKITGIYDSVVSGRDVVIDEVGTMVMIKNPSLTHGRVSNHYQFSSRGNNCLEKDEAIKFS